MIALVAMLYSSTYAIYASGKDAVLGGTIVMALGFVIWGFIAPRFSGKAGMPAPEPRADRTRREEREYGQSAQSESSSRHRGVSSRRSASQCWRPSLRCRCSACGGGRHAGSNPPGGQRSSSGTGTTRGRFRYKDESGKAAGYSIALCEKIADDVKTELGLPSDCRVGSRHARRSLPGRAAGQGRPVVRSGHRDVDKEEGRLVLDPHLSERDRGDSSGQTLPSSCARCWRAGRHRVRSGARSPARILRRRRSLSSRARRARSWLTDRMDKVPYRRHGGPRGQLPGGHPARARPQFRRFLRRPPHLV